MFKRFLSLTLLLPMLLVFDGWGQINITSGNTITQNFDIGPSATATMPTNWKVDKNSTARTVGTFTAAVSATEIQGGNSLSATASNGIYNFGAGAANTATDRAVGGLSSSSASKSVNVYAYLNNNGAGSIPGFTISYAVEKYRNGSNAAGYQVQLYYSTDGNNWTSAGSNFLTSFAADADNAGFASAPGATSNVSNKILNVSVAAGSKLYLAWNYSVSSGTATGNAQALAIDDVSITALSTQPTASATSIGFSSVTTTGMTINWTSGDGAGRLVLVKAGSAVDATPVDGTDYTVNSIFGTSGTQIGTGNYAVYKGNGNSVAITGLTAGTTYHIAIIEYNGTSTSINYLTPTSATGNRTTLSSEPDVSASNITFASVQPTSMTINWTNGNGAGRAVFVGEGSVGSITDPTDGNTYSASADWNSKGTQLGTSGYYCVYDGTGNSFSLTNLSSGTSYYVYIYEYNGSGTSINYRTTSPANSSQATLSAGPDPNVALTGTDPGSAQILAGSNGNIIYRTQVSVTGSSVTMTSAGFLTTGNYTASDLASGGLKLYYSSDATFDLSDTQIGSITSTSNGTDGDILLFSGLNQSFAVGTAYLFLTTDISSSATLLRTISTSLPQAADFTFSGTVTKTGSSFVAGSVHTIYTTPPTLTADNTSNNVDNDIDITFTDNTAWESAITSVNIGGTPLTLTTDYVVSAGTIKLKPSGGNTLLRTAGSKSVTVVADGYTTASVTQQINAGAPTSNNSTASISPVLALNTTSTVTLTAKDQYNNLVSGYTFVYDATITDANATTDESYTINGTARTASVSNIALTTQTDASGICSFQITVPSTVDENDGISVQVQLADGTTNIGSAFSFTYIPPPNVAISAMVPLTSNFIKGRDNNILQRFDVSVTGGDVTLNSLTVTTAGTYVAADIKTNGFKLWYSADTVFSSASDALISTKAVVGPSNNIAFNSLSSTVLNNSSGSFFVTVDISNSATTNNTIQISSTAHSNIVFAIATLIGVNPVSAGGTKTIDTLTLPLVEHFDYATGSVTTNGAGWTFTSGTAGQVTVENGNLTYTGYDMPATGRSITITPTESEDVRLIFPNVNSGKVYASFLMNVSAITGTGEYFIHLGNGTGNFTCRVYGKPDGAGFALAIGKNGVGSSYSGTLNFNQTYLIVIGYEFVGTNASDDVVRLWINPDLSGAEPSSTLSFTNQPDVTNTLINGFYVRQATGIPTATIDAIRISTNWADAPLPVELTSFTAKASGTTVTLNWETKTEVDNNGFEVERNATGTWQKIGFVEGHGTANSPKYYSFSDVNPLGNKIQYRLKQIDNDGTFEYSPVVEVELNPTQFTVYQNYPNPFNPSTVIRFALPVAGNVTVNVFNTLGEKVATLLDGPMEAGYQQVTFDAANFPSGLYFYEISAGEFKSIKKMLLMK